MTATFDTSILAPQHVAAPFDTAKYTYLRRELSKGITLYHAGDPAETLYRVEQGLLKLSIDLLTGKERITYIAGPGDFLGALTPAHLDYQESAEALSPRVVVQAFQKDEINHDLKNEVFAAAGLRLSRLHASLEDTDLPVTARLARTFLRLGQRFGHLSDDGTVRLTLPLTHEHLAAMVGAARETTTAILSEMRSNGVLTGTRGRYSFCEQELSHFASEAAFAYL